MSTDLDKLGIPETINKQRKFYNSFETLSYDFRINQLKKLRKYLKENAKEITDALYKDLHKSEEEAYLTELSSVFDELDLHISELKNWMKPEKRKLSYKVQPASGEIQVEPLGVSLIISPWNYPFNLTMIPFIGAISAGNTVILKPSSESKHVTKFFKKMVNDLFNDEYVALFEGGKETNQKLLKEKLDMIFFTGSSEVGKKIMEAASKNLTPVVLELGGKSPSIVDVNADVAKAAQRLMWGKAMNSAQTCIAPDYLFIHESLKDEFIEECKKVLKKMHGDDMQQSKHYCRMISDEAFDRVSGYLSQGNILLGGNTDKEDRYIELTIMDEVSMDADVMQTEIFGPVLPLFTFNHVNEVIEHLQTQPKPLAFYYFGTEEVGREVLKRTTSGGACINHTLVHIAGHALPFGGVGYSGMGHYHGKETFLAFSHERSVLFAPTLFNVPTKYPPFPGMDLLKKVEKLK